jgi:hypothetical protein
MGSPAVAVAYGGGIASSAPWAFAERDRIPRTIASISVSLSVPPADFAKAGMAVPGTPLAVTRRNVAASAIWRNTGSARPLAAPPLPSNPWHPAQFAA